MQNRKEVALTESKPDIIHSDSEIVPEAESESPTIRENSSKTSHTNRLWQKFVQQELRGWSPIITATGVVVYFFAVGVVMLALGIPILLASLGVKEVKSRYDNAGIMATATNAARLAIMQTGNGNTLTVNVTITEDMEPPIYVYYELHDFYQNHKRYVRSVASKQAGGGGGTTKGCPPQQYLGGSSNSSLPNNGLVLPCGLIAWSQFNDTFAVADSSTGRGVFLNETDISWKFDRDHLYGDFIPENYNDVAPFRGGNTTTVPLNTAEHFIVWMRVAAKKTFRKLYAHIDTKLTKGTNLTITVQNRFNTYQFEGAKVVVLSTNSWMGGRNNFLGIVYLIVSGLCFAISFAFFATYHLRSRNRREFADERLLSWNRHKQDDL